MDMVAQEWAYAVISASGNVVAGQVLLGGIFVSAGTTPTVTVYDDAATGTSVPVVTIFTPSLGIWIPLPFLLRSGLNIVVSGAGFSATVGYLRGFPFNVS